MHLPLQLDFVVFVQPGYRNVRHEWAELAASVERVDQVLKPTQDEPFPSAIMSNNS